MRAEQAMPYRLWPHGMVIEIENHDHRICELLWARDTYHIDPGAADVPPVTWPEPQMPPANHPSAALRRSWAPLWRRLWLEALAWYATNDDDVAPTMRALAEDERVDDDRLLREAAPPSWFAAVGPANFDRLAFAHWDEESVDLLIRAHEVGESEEDAMDALTAAWHRGLRRIVEIPTIGEYTRELAPDTLLVTAATRSDAAGYARALDFFRRHG